MTPSSPRERATSALSTLGLPTSDVVFESTRRFPDGTRFRVEIPSVEGPAAFEAALQAADALGVRFDRISQGSGIMLLTDDEITQMVALGGAHKVDVCLFVGPRAAWDVGAQAVAAAGRVVAGSLRGADQLRSGLSDVFRAVDLGLRSVLVADVGLLSVVGRLRETGDLPRDLTMKVSVSLPVANPATARLFEELGADTLNLPVDLSVAQIAAIRQVTTIPLDVYVESPDDFGGFIRYHELPDIVRAASPVYIKFAVRNAASLYPSGEHLAPMVIATAKERVRRSAIGLALLEREGITS